MIFPRIPRLDADWEPRPTPHLILPEATEEVTSDTNRCPDSEI
jgi:hypothetical protein